MEEFYYEESNPNHVFIKCLIILFILGISIGAFYFFKKNNTIKLKNITLEIGESLSKNIEDYIVSGNKYLDEYKLYISDVDTNKIGEYKYKVKYNKHVETGFIKVVDTIKPKVKTADLIMGINEELNLDMVLTECDDKSLPCKVSLKNERDLNKLKKPGVYNLKINVSDAAGNITESEVKITSSETQTMSSLHTSDLNYYTNSEKDDTIEHIMYYELEKAINEETLEYEGLIQEISAEDFDLYVNDDKEIYDIKLITAYNKYNYVIGFQVLATFTDGSTRLLTK